MNAFTLRDYQKLASNGILEQFKEHNSTLLIIPTGGGKTCIFADIIRRMHPQRAMVLAHRSELIYQAKEKIEHVTGLECAIEMADLVAGATLWTQTPVIVSTVQTQVSGPEGKERFRRFDPMQFGLLIIDEAHHGTAKSYRKLIDYYRQNADLRVLGVTATPDRADEEALGQIFESVAFDYEIIDAIHAGYLVPIDQQLVKVHGLDFSAVRTTAGDLNGGDLAAIMEEEKNMQGVAGACIEIIQDKRTLVFTASVKQAETLCNIFNRHRADMAGWVCGKTDRETRRQLLKDFETGKIQVVINCGVLTEGYDNPAVEIVVMARPTKSRSLYSQMVGRGTRSLLGVIDGLSTPSDRRTAIAASAKSALLVVDFVGNSGRHKLMTSADILGGKNSEEAIELAKTKMKERGTRVSISDVLDEAEDEIKKQREYVRQQEEARKARLVAKAQFSMSSVDPFERYNVRYEKATEWTRKSLPPLSEKQRFVLKKHGVHPDSITPGCGKKMLNAIFQHPTPGQSKVLVRYGYSLNCTAKEASMIIDKLAANGWRKPEPELQPT